MFVLFKKKNCEEQLKLKSSKSSTSLRTLFIQRVKLVHGVGGWIHIHSIDKIYLAPAPKGNKNLHCIPSRGHFMNMRLKLVIINSLQMLILEIYQIAARMCIFHFKSITKPFIKWIKKRPYTAASQIRYIYIAIFQDYVFVYIVSLCLNVQIWFA